MEIVIGKTAGFCYGVKRAVESAEKDVLNTNEKIYCLGELVHNNDVIKSLEEKGLEFIENIEDAKGMTIIRAHGVSKDIYEKADKLNIKIKDLTCPKVLKIHNIAEDYANNGYFIFLIGDKKHPEIIGTYSFCGKDACIIENNEDIKPAFESFKKSKKEKLLVIVQTTYSVQKFNDICKEINLKASKNINIEIKNTICMATELRQKETDELSKSVDTMLIVGGKQSSNTRKLYDISLKNCKNVVWVENKTEIDLENFKNSEKIGIMAGASTPKNVILDAYNFLNENLHLELASKT